jgi:hypothetical protein
MYANQPRLNVRHTSQTSAAEWIPVSLPIEVDVTGSHAAPSSAEWLSEDGVAIRRLPMDGRVRHVWLRFRVPGTNEEIRALGEVAPGGTTPALTRYLFKHLFPHHRDLLRQFVDANSPSNAQAQL